MKQKKVSDKTRIRKLQKKVKEQQQALFLNNAHISRLSEKIAASVLVVPPSGDTVALSARVSVLEEGIRKALQFPVLDPQRVKTLQDALTPPVSGQAG